MTFEDNDKDGVFDATWIAGFEARRAASDVHDLLDVRCMIVARNGRYVVFCGLDVIGLFRHRMDQATAVLEAEDSVDPRRVIISASHTYHGPDTLGPWGFPDEDPELFVTGYDVAYQAKVVDAIVAAVP